MQVMIWSNSIHGIVEDIVKRSNHPSLPSCFGRCIKFTRPDCNNKLGHGPSHSVLQEILTEGSYEKTESTKENEVALPENCIKERFTVLVEDRIDRLEGTLSGELRSRECYTNNLFPAIK